MDRRLSSPPWRAGSFRRTFSGCYGSKAAVHHHPAAIASWGTKRPDHVFPPSTRNASASALALATKESSKRRDSRTIASCCHRPRAAPAPPLVVAHHNARVHFAAPNGSSRSGRSGQKSHDHFRACVHWSEPAPTVKQRRSIHFFGPSRKLCTTRNSCMRFRSSMTECVP